MYARGVGNCCWGFIKNIQKYKYKYKKYIFYYHNNNQYRWKCKYLLTQLRKQSTIKYHLFSFNKLNIL